MTDSDVRAHVDRYYALVDARDLDAMLDLFADDARYERPGYEPLCGRRDIEAFYRGNRVIAAGSHTLDDVVIEGRTAAVRGRFDGELKDGRSVSVRFADFFRYESDRIAERHTYFFQPSV